MKTSLGQHVYAYDHWKHDLRTEIDSYERWLNAADLSHADLTQLIDQARQSIEEDELTLAIVGEFSRGKTELINALIFAHHGVRVLPSKAGRTTMCPTEIFCDRTSNQDYIRLLPIETRRSALTIGEARHHPQHWEYFPFQPNDVEMMQQTFDQISARKSVSATDAEQLGFEAASLELDPDNPDFVLVPKWRHALISIDNPILKNGLRLLDTPGLNALGSEPELTMNMIPNAQAVLFMLSADAGVTASDLATWNEMIDTDDTGLRAGMFAVLNKIDTLWNDPQGEAYVEKSIADIKKETARVLSIDQSNILTLAAKQGLLARMEDDQALLQKSGLIQFEQFIARSIIERKQLFVRQRVLRSIMNAVDQSQQILHDRLASLHRRMDELERAEMGEADLKSMADQLRVDNAKFKERVAAIKTCKQLLASQAEVLKDRVSIDHFENMIEMTRKSLQESWSTMGMSKAIGAFFKRFENDLHTLIDEGERANTTVQAMFERLGKDVYGKRFQFQAFSIKVQLLELQEMRRRATQYRRHPKMVLTEQTVIIRNFFQTFVRQVRTLHESIHDYVEQWPNDVLMPIVQYMQEQKKIMDAQISDVKSLASHNTTLRDSQKAIQTELSQTNTFIREASTFQQNLMNAPKQIA